MLPTVEGKHQDLKYITPDVVRRSFWLLFFPLTTNPLFLSLLLLLLCESYMILKCVPCALQMVEALTDHFNHLVERVIVIDCRYPYEFEGGHIKVRSDHCRL